MNFSKNEKELIGHWEFRDGKMNDDENAKRVEWLIKNHLKKVGSDESGWDILYIDPEDNRLWELIYFHGEMHGGGPPSLVNISEEEADKKYPNHLPY
ncbi:Imm27 family immunity protein [Pedobacter sp.]|jgi:hypothetical protein|uniref:Imm27 family immunity protein n=1 Tax=Pedobacter sp. TaxID=1411316 RepID=UPI002D16D80B|nr:Imm27 family immunity protein [Pedobacter sp.]HWW39596.1 Imm27 family immunity protein [Pedobacter sp.]